MTLGLRLGFDNFQDGEYEEIEADLFCGFVLFRGEKNLPVECFFYSSKVSLVCAERTFLI